MIDKTPRLTPFNINSVMRVKRTVQDSPEVVKFIGADLSVEDYAELVDCLEGVLPSGISRPAIYDSLLHLVGRTLTSEELPKIAWRLAGNLSRLRRHEAVPAWTTQTSLEWVPAQIVESLLGRDYKQTLGSTFSFRILAGTSAGLIVSKFWTARYCGFLSGSMGFTRSYGKYPYSDLIELVGLRLYLLCDPEHSGNRPGFNSVRVTPSLEDFNKDKIKIRLRDGFDCPKNFPIIRVCRKCPVGYDECPAAVHPRTFSSNYCYNCEENKLFDPSDLSECVECSRRGRIVINKKD